MKAVRWMFAIVGIVAAAVLGVLGGNWYLDYRHDQRLQDKVGGLEAGTSTALREGMEFPAVRLVDVDGEPTTTRDLIGSGGALAVFVSLGCDVCSEAVISWTGSLPGVPDEMTVFGIADREYEYVRVYGEKENFPFPLYADEVDAFGAEYDMNVYPTAVGVDGAGRIVFVKHGFRRDFTLEQALAMLVK